MLGWQLNCHPNKASNIKPLCVGRAHNKKRTTATMPQDLLYNKTHEWVRLSDDKKTATVGLTALALELLTDLVYVELPEVGRQLKAEEPFGEIESVKAVSDLYSPVNGEVAEVNSAVADNLERLADDPYGNGWFFR